MDVLKYLHENGCPWDEWTCRAAANGGHLAALKFARQNGCPWDKRTCERAAAGGHLDVLEYAHKSGCPWDQETPYYAALNDHFDLMKWAITRGCPWRRSLCRKAAEKSDYAGEDVVAWIDAQPNDGEAPDPPLPLSHFWTSDDEEEADVMYQIY